MVRDYIALFIFGAPVAAVACLMAGQPALALGIGGMYYATYRLVRRLVLAAAGVVLLAIEQIRAWCAA